MAVVAATGSLGFLSDGSPSALDLIAAAVTYFSVRVADKPADRSHPFGHGKVEHLSAFIETALLLATCAWIVRYLPSYDLLAIVGGGTSMAVAPAFAIVVGDYPRLAPARLSWSVRSARQAQGPEIAHDRHD